jgi:hypothetical protein
MNNYELKQALLDRLEIEELIAKIQRLEKENAILKYDLKLHDIASNKDIDLRTMIFNTISK